MEESFLKEKAVLVTGSVQGIGLAIARTLAGTGARVAVHGLAAPQQRDEAVATLRASGAGDVRFFDADLRDPSAIEDMMHAAGEWSGGLDVLVNNAGIQIPSALAETKPETWNDILAINLSAAFHTMRLALPAMARRGYGRVINIASVHGLVGSTEKGPYVAAKSGLVGLSRVAALEYAQAGTRGSGGVTVNCICPGYVETGLIESQIRARAEELGGGREAGVRSMLSEKQPTLRLTDASEIGALSLWLCAPMAHNVTGAAIPIDGGWTAR
ncbi:MAG: 3-hydroxybutyrate dehydrogenase [Hyphomicrobiales bacterium]